MLTSTGLKANSIHSTQVRVVIKGMEIYQLEGNDTMD